MPSLEFELLVRLEEKLDDVLVKTAKIDALEDDVKELKASVKELKEDQESLKDLVGKWKGGAALLFALGGLAVWVIDHYTIIKRFFGF